MNYYQELNMSPDTDIELLRSEMVTLQRKWQKRTNAPKLDHRQEAERQLAWISDAIEVFSSSQAKADYDQGLFGYTGSSQTVLMKPFDQVMDIINKGYYIGGQKSLENLKNEIDAYEYAFLQMELYRLQLTTYLNCPERIMEYGTGQASKRLDLLKTSMFNFYKANKIYLEAYDDQWIQPMMTRIVKLSTVHITSKSKKVFFLGFVLCYVLLGIQDLFWGILGYRTIYLGPGVLVLALFYVFYKRECDFDQMVRERSF